MELVPARNRFNKLLCSTIFPYTNVCVKFDIFIPIPESQYYWYGKMLEYESVDICELGIRKIIVSVGSSKRPLDVVWSNV